MSNRANFHAVDRVHVLAVDSASTCVKVDVMLDSNNNCVTSVNGVMMTSYKRNWLSVEVNGNDTTITVPNCVDGALTMSVSCKVTRFGIGFQEFRVLRGLNLNEQSHGIIGQFWNIRTKVTKYNETLIDDTIHPNAYRIDVYPPSSDSRSFVGFLEDVTWDFSDQPCIYAGNSQGGPTYEVKDGGPNDGLLEGDVKDYIMDGPYDVLFDYNHFHSSNRCN
jgi:collagen type VI alpha